MAGPTVSTTFNAIDKLTGPTNRMKGTVGSFAKSTAKYMLAAGAAVGAAALAVDRVVGAFADKGDEIAKTSRMLGLSTDALQELRYASGMQGVETEALNNGFKLLNNQLGQLKTGTGTMLQTLKRTNPQLARQLETVNDTDQAFMMLMDALKAETDVAKRAALAQAAFGRAGQELIKFADAGADGIATLRKEAHKYGLVIGQEVAEKSEEFSDSLSRLKQTAGSLFNTVLGQAVIKLQPMIQGMADWTAANRELINQKIEGVINGIGTAAKFVADAWNSGLLPAVLAGVATFKAITLAIGAYQSVLATAKAVQIAFNLAMAANPIGLIIVGISALVAGIVLLIQHLDKVKALFDWIGDKAAAVGGFMRSLSLGGKGSDGYDPLNDPTGLVSANQGVIESRSVSESRQTVDINIGGLPQGSTVKERGTAPAVRLNTGFGGVRGAN